MTARGDHTFTVLASSPREGLVGLAIASSPLAVASRCAFVRSRVGAVATQAYSNPAIGPRALTLLGSGLSAAETLTRIQAEDPYPDIRQIGIVSAAGEVAVTTGARCLPWNGHASGENWIAMGNYLVGPRVLAAMVDSWRASEGEILEERLLRGIEAARDAGGEVGGPPLSAALIVHGEDEYSRTDLRVDMHQGAPEEDAIHDLRRILDRFKPLIPYYQARARNPFLPPWKEWLARTAAKA